jgi:hypothetical protein
LLYRFRLNDKRGALIRDALIGLMDGIDVDLRAFREIAGHDPKGKHQLEAAALSDLREHMRQIEVLLGSSVTKPDRWGDMVRHVMLPHEGDLHVIEHVDWPEVKASLRKGLYGANEALPVQIEDLAHLVASRPSGPITTQLAWARLEDEEFERLIFSLISDTQGYENPEWLRRSR